MITSGSFDMYVLLFDTEIIYFACYKKAAAQQGWDFSFELFKSCVGISREEAWKFMKQNFGPQADVQRLDARTFELVDEYLQSGGPVEFRPGAKEAIEFFYKRGLKLGLASSNIRRWVDFYLKKKRIAHYFSAITTCEEVTQLKPDPEVYLKTAQKLGADVTQCLAFDDSVAGATAAIRAGMRTCMVPQIKQPDTFVRQHAFKIYNSLHDIYPDMDDLLG